MPRILKATPVKVVLCLYNINISILMLSSSNIWEEMVRKESQNPDLFKKYETDHDIRKLKL